MWSPLPQPVMRGPHDTLARVSGKVPALLVCRLLLPLSLAIIGVGLVLPTTGG